MNSTRATVREVRFGIGQNTELRRAVLRWSKDSGSAWVLVSRVTGHWESKSPVTALIGRYETDVVSVDHSVPTSYGRPSRAAKKLKHVLLPPPKFLKYYSFRWRLFRLQTSAFKGPALRQHFQPTISCRLHFAMIHFFNVKDPEGDLHFSSNGHRSGFSC
jgi:hypothetical protein